MIARVWRGKTSAAKADAYEAFLKRTARPDYGGVAGNRGWVLLRRAAAEEVEFMFVSFWESMEAVRRYAGADPERPNYYPEDLAALLELPERADHYELVDLVGWEPAP
jgi:heme-degrading monooxygenase HmoA